MEPFSIKTEPTSKTEHNRKYYEKTKPYPVRMGTLEPPIREFCFDCNKTMAEFIREAIEEKCLRLGIAFEARNKSLIPKPTKNMRITRMVRRKVKVDWLCQLCLEFTDVQKN